MPKLQKQMNRGWLLLEDHCLFRVPGATFLFLFPQYSNIFKIQELLKQARLL
jgi:hypothetical protein